MKKQNSWKFWIPALYICACTSLCAEVNVQTNRTQEPKPKTEKLIDSSHQGSLFIVSGPSGSGKTTLVEMLMKEFPNDTVSVVSYTTRKIRPGEINGVHYHFITEEQFDKMLANHEFLEYTKFVGSSYGATKKDVSNELLKGKQVFLVINTETALEVQRQVDDATLIFVSPPSLEVVKERLKSRGTESDEVIAKRVAQADKEMVDGRLFDYNVVNGDLQIAYQIFKSIVVAKNHEIR